MDFLLAILCALTNLLLLFHGAHNASTAPSRGSHYADGVLKTFVWQQNEVFVWLTIWLTKKCFKHILSDQISSFILTMCLCPSVCRWRRKYPSQLLQENDCSENLTDIEIVPINPQRLEPLSRSSSKPSAKRAIHEEGLCLPDQSVEDACPTQSNSEDTLCWLGKGSIDEPTPVISDIVSSGMY